MNKNSVRTVIFTVIGIIIMFAVVSFNFNKALENNPGVTHERLESELAAYYEAE